MSILSAKKNRAFPESILLFFVALVFFVPTFKSSLNLVFEQFFMLAIMASSLAFVVIVPQKSNRTIIPIGVFFVYSVLLIISAIRGTGEQTGIRDLLEILKPVFFISAFYLGSTVRWCLSSTHRFVIRLNMLFVGLALWGILESTTGLFNGIAVQLYKDTRSSLNFKAVGPFIVPYVYASIMLLPFFYNLASVVLKRRLFGKNGIYLLLAFLAVILSQSRTVFLALVWGTLIFALTVLLVKEVPNRKRYLTMFLCAMAGIVIGSVLYYDEIRSNFSYLVVGLEVVVNRFLATGLSDLAAASPSIGNRYDQLLFAVESQDAIPLIGVGIGKYLFMPESYYALNYYRVGVLGIIVHFAVVAAAMHKCFSSLIVLLTEINPISSETGKKIVCASFFWGAAIYLCTLPVSYVSSAINEQTRTGFLFYLLLAVIFGMQVKRRERFD